MIITDNNSGLIHLYQQKKNLHCSITLIQLKILFEQIHLVHVSDNAIRKISKKISALNLKKFKVN